MDIARNRALVEMALGPKDSGVRWKYAEDLLALDTGNWFQGPIVHHCSGIFCCSGGKQESRKKLWTAILVPCHV